MKRIANPNFIYIITFIIPFLVYSLGWSTIYPTLTPELLGFYLLTFLIAFLIGLLIDRLPGFVYKRIPVFRYNTFVIIGVYFFYALDYLYMGYIPLFSFSVGSASYTGGKDFGIPIFHVLLVTFNVFFALYLFHQYISNRKWSLLLLYISAFVPFVLSLERSNIMYIIVGSAFLFTISIKKIVLKQVVRLFAFVIFALYIFGYLGNLRSANGDSTFIPRNSGVTEEFLQSWIPNEFYWGYLYIGSPVANLQNNITTQPNVYPDYAGLVLFEMTPDFLSKKIAAMYSLTRRNFNQINGFLNVGTIYARAFSFLSWSGMIIMFVYLIILINLYYLIIRKSFLYGATGLSIMFCMIAFSNFSNTISFSAFSFQLVYPILFSGIRGLIVKPSKPLNAKAQVRLG